MNSIRRPRTTAQHLLRSDALFELALGAPLLAAGATGRVSALKLPPPASDAVVAVFGGGLLPFAAVLWRESGRAGAGAVGTLAAVNALTGVSFAGWLVARRARAGRRGALLVGGTAGVLLGLGAAQARVARQLR